MRGMRVVRERDGFRNWNCDLGLGFWSCLLDKAQMPKLVVANTLLDLGGKAQI